MTSTKASSEATKAAAGGEVTNMYLQQKFNLSPTCDQLLSQLISNAERNPNRSIPALKSLIFYTPRREALDSILTLMKHEKDKVERLCHLLLIQLAQKQDILNDFGAISSSLHKGVTSADITRRVLAIRSYGALLPVGQTFQEMFADIIFPILKSCRDLNTKISAELKAKKINSKAFASQNWEIQVQMMYGLLSIRLCPSPDTFFNDSHRAETTQLLSFALQSPEPILARHSTALIYHLSSKFPKETADLLKPFLPTSNPTTTTTAKAQQQQQQQQDLTLQAPGVLKDSLAGTYFIRTCAYLSCCQALNPSLANEFLQSVCKAVLSDSTKIFCEASLSIASNCTSWEQFSKITVAQQTQPPQQGASPSTAVIEQVPLINVILRRIVSLCSPEMKSMPAKLAAIRLTANLSREFSKSMLKNQTHVFSSVFPQPLQMVCYESLARIAGSSEESATLRGSALVSLCWLAQTPTELISLSPLLNSMLSTSKYIFSEIWRSFDTRVKQNPVLSNSFLDLCSRALLSAPPLTFNYPMESFHSSWISMISLDRSSTIHHLLTLLEHPYAPDNRSTLLDIKRDICVFISDNILLLLGNSNQNQNCLNSIISALEIQATTGSLMLRRAAVESLGQISVRIPNARVRVSEFLQSLQSEYSTSDLCDSISQILVTLSGKSSPAQIAALRSQIQLLWDPSSFVF